MLRAAIVPRRPSCPLTLHLLGPARPRLDASSGQNCACSVSMTVTNQQPAVRPRLRLLCLHSFRTSAAIFKEQFRRSGLDRRLEDLAELVFIDAPNAASGPPEPEVQPFFEPPYYEWWNFLKDEDGNMQYVGYEESLQCVRVALTQLGPFDGLVGFSQGGVLTSVVLGLQQQKLVDLPPLRLCIIFGSGPSRYPPHQVAYDQKIRCPALLSWGTRDRLAPWSNVLPDRFESPVVVVHDKGHVVPNLNSEQLSMVRSFVQQQQQQHSPQIHSSL